MAADPNYARRAVLVNIHCGMGEPKPEAVDSDIAVWTDRHISVSTRAKNRVFHDPHRSDVYTLLRSCGTKCGHCDCGRNVGAVDSRYANRSAANRDRRIPTGKGIIGFYGAICIRISNGPV